MLIAFKFPALKSIAERGRAVEKKTLRCPWVGSRLSEALWIKGVVMSVRRSAIKGDLERGRFESWARYAETAAYLQSSPKAVSPFPAQFQPFDCPAVKGRPRYWNLRQPAWEKSDPTRYPGFKIWQRPPSQLSTPKLWRSTAYLCAAGGQQRGNATRPTDPPRKQR